MKIKALPLLSAVAATMLLSPTAQAVTLFTDNFTVSSNVNEPNFENGTGRQGGTLATPTLSYVSRYPSTNRQQVGNATTFPGNSNALLLAFGGAAKIDYNFATVASPIEITFDGLVSNGASTAADNWIGMHISTSASGGNFVNEGAFGVLFRANGGTQYFNGSVGTDGPTATATGFNVFDQYKVVLSDVAGTGSAFGTGGSKVEYYKNGTLINTVITTNQLTAGYIGFSATSVGGIDNLVIRTIPESGSMVLVALGAGLVALRRRK